MYTPQISIALACHFQSKILSCKKAIMRIILSTSLILLIIILLTVQGGLTSCTKDHTIIDTVTVIKKDTITIKDTLLTAEILSANKWKYQVYRGVAGGDSVVYYRGGTSNTDNRDNDYIEFYNDGSGTGFSMDPAGYSHLIKEWQFTNAEHTQMTFKYYVTNSPIYHFITYDNIRYKNKSLMFDEYYHDNYININVHDQTVRIPK
jgi:hypothetical protein